MNQNKQNKEYTFQTKANYMYLTAKPKKGEKLKLADRRESEDQRWFLDTFSAIRNKQNMFPHQGGMSNSNYYRKHCIHCLFFSKWSTFKCL